MLYILIYTLRPILPFQATLTPITQSISETDRHGNYQAQAQRTRSPLVVIVHRSPVLDLIHPPQEQAHAVHQSDDCDDGESPSRGHGDAIAEIQEGRCYRTQDDGEFELLS